ncbi:hypothetical protein [Paenibacillus xylanivorans]|uniref:Uncharacterized protein n=1 Tax=Paenibacillus xylanivorans TaxID=1705561 RepID=A0A0N0C5W9_9BACL|nr:hypothetical protein [Paenibacillus xylanivorans]KOY17874.1 hypothetical protein AMS66_03445 [Paenibacillus xylanivorans]
MLVTKAKDQPEVDKFIIEERPEEQEFKKRSTKRNKRGERSRKFETRFTWLRNQVGHTQENSEITEVINKMKNCYKELQEIVKIAIEKFI